MYRTDERFNPVGRPIPPKRMHELSKVIPTTGTIINHDPGIRENERVERGAPLSSQPLGSLPVSSKKGGCIIGTL